MDVYEIIMTPDSVSDITELRNYIADTLLAKETALAYVRAVRKEIETLSEMPAKYKLMDAEPWHSLGIRRLQAKNFFVYYRVDESEKKVHILNIIYARRDQLNALANMDVDFRE